MKGVWKWSLGLSLGLLAGGASAQEVPWHAASPPAGPAQRTENLAVVAPAATLARPIPQPPAAVAAPAAPAATLARPVPLGVVDGQVRPASFFGGDSAAPATVRGLSPDAAKPMPVGPGPADSGTLKMPTKIPAPAGDPTLVPYPVIPPPDPVPGADVPVPGGGMILDGDEPGMVEADAVDGPLEGVSGNPHRFYARAEYLMWWVKNSPTPPLISASPSAGPLAGSAADANAHIIYGGDSVFLQSRSGARFTAGYWFDDAESLGLEGSAFFLGQGGAHFAAGAPGTRGAPGLYVPFTNSETGRPMAQEVGGIGPRRQSGVIGADLDNRTWGAELDLRGNLIGAPDGPFRLGVLGGFRVFGMDESLSLSRNSTEAPDPEFAPNGLGIVASDRFQTMNRFYAPQVGLSAEVRRGPWSLDVTTKLAMGVVHQDVDVSGVTLFNTGTAVIPHNGGLFALPTNEGHHDRNRFAVMPEVGANIGYQVTDCCRVYVGYSFLYLSSVVRPGDQIDTNVNTSQVPDPLNPRGAAALKGHTRPLFQFHGNDYWAHGANFGLEFRY